MMMTTEDVLAELDAACARAGGRAAWARAHELSPAYVSDVLRGRREPGPGILRALRLKRVVSYRRTGGEEERRDG